MYIIFVYPAPIDRPLRGWGGGGGGTPALRRDAGRRRAAALYNVTLYYAYFILCIFNIEQVREHHRDPQHREKIRAREAYLLTVMHLHDVEQVREYHLDLQDHENYNT